jgi:hypothetical protein
MLLRFIWDHMDGWYIQDILYKAKIRLRQIG